MKEETQEFRCVKLKGELADWGNHILLPYGITLCGQAVVDYDKSKFPLLADPRMKDLINEYQVVEWDITCGRCLEMFGLIEKIDRAKKSKNN